MLSGNQEDIFQKLFEGLQKEDTARKSADAFLGELSECYRSALKDGLDPGMALAALVAWAAEEMKR
ncbi:MAG: hypothetical protein WBX25_22010 [Rhodomicrobium sp.]